MKAKLTLSMALVAALTIATGAAVTAQDEAPTGPSPEALANEAIGYSLAPPNIELDGRSRTDLVKEHLAWFFFDATPDTHPGQLGDCMIGQPGGDTFYLPHAQHGQLAHYECTIRADQHILAWFGGPICLVTPGEEPGAAAAFCDAAVGHINPELTINGQTTPISGNYWLNTGEYVLDLAEDNFFGLPPGERGVGAAGWWTLIEPLPAGEYTIMTRNDLYDPGFGFRDRGDDSCGLSTCTARALMSVTVVEAEAAG